MVPYSIFYIQYKTHIQTHIQTHIHIILPLPLFWYVIKIMSGLNKHMTLWPSGLRCYVKAAVFWVWVQIPLESFLVFVLFVFPIRCECDLGP